MTIAFQGELGAFSEEAVRAVFEDAEVVPYSTFDDAFEALEEGAVDRAVIPIENSLFGSVHANYDLLRTHDVQIVGEHKHRIRHHLMGVSSATMEGVRRVVSHPQALGQCRAFLQERLPQAETQPSYDTAGAARDVAEGGAPEVAAIASASAAERYGLQVLASEVEDHPQNFTRFLMLARDADDRPANPNKTSIVFALHENVPGALFKSLAVFALRELDLFKIESRPQVGRPGRYLFYLDIEGAASDEAVHRALDHLHEITTMLKVLGSYRRDETFT